MKMRIANKETGTTENKIRPKLFFESGVRCQKCYRLGVRDLDQGVELLPSSWDASPSGTVEGGPST